MVSLLEFDRVANLIYCFTVSNGTKQSLICIVLLIGKHFCKFDFAVVGVVTFFDPVLEFRLHIPVITDDNIVCQSWFGSGIMEIHMKKCQCWFFDVSRPHAVINNSEIDRVHIVIDCFNNDTLREVIL